MPHCKVCTTLLLGRRSKITTTDASGRFQLDGVAPGDYKLFAWEDVEDGAWLDSAFMKLDEDKGTPMRVGEGSKTMVDVPLILQAPNR